MTTIQKIQLNIPHMQVFHRQLPLDSRIFHFPTHDMTDACVGERYRGGHWRLLWNVLQVCMTWCVFLTTAAYFSGG